MRDIGDIKRHDKDIKEALFLAQAQVDLQNQQFQNTDQREGSKGAKLKSLFIRQNSRFSEMKTWQAESDERQIKERRKQLLDALSTHDYLTPLKQGRRKRHSGTLEWLFQTQEYLSWVNATNSSLLWCSGKSKFSLHYSYKASIFF